VEWVYRCPSKASLAIRCSFHQAFENSGMNNALSSRFPPLCLEILRPSSL
ncbi:hypothetical protein KUCAC02_020150, partial [Chaenocephalus aceratus]